MFIYEATISYTEEGTIRFRAENEDDAYKVLREKLPPLPNLEITSLVCLGQDPAEEPKILN